MSDQMTVVFAKNTGNVLSVLTRVSDSTALTIDDIANPGLMVRDSKDVRIVVPAKSLDVLTVDLIPEALLSPRSYSVDAQKKQAQILPVTSVMTVTPQSGSVLVDLTKPVTVDTNVFVAVFSTGMSEPEVATGTISASGADKQKLTLLVNQAQAGSAVLALATGFVPSLTNF